MSETWRTVITDGTGNVVGWHEAEFPDGGGGPSEPRSAYEARVRAGGHSLHRWDGKPDWPPTPGRHKVNAQGKLEDRPDWSPGSPA